jgi:hypothetical protein
MDPPEEQLAAFIRLLEVAEELYPYVSLERLRRLARSDPGWGVLGGSVGRLVRHALRRGILLSDSRQRLTRAGDFRPVQVYRLNRRNELVARVLASEIPCGADDQRVGRR